MDSQLSLSRLRARRLQSEQRQPVIVSADLLLTRSVQYFIEQLRLMSVQRIKRRHVQRAVLVVMLEGYEIPKRRDLRTSIAGQRFCTTSFN